MTIAGGVIKGGKAVLKALRTPGKKKIDGVKVKKIPEGKRSMSPAAMEKLRKEGPPIGGVEDFSKRPKPRTPKTQRKNQEIAERYETGLQSEGRKRMTGSYIGRIKKKKDGYTHAEQKEREAYKKKHLVYPEDDPRNYKKSDKGAQAALKRMLKAGTLRKAGGQVVKKYKEGKQVASADWMQGLSQKRIDEILGRPSTDKEGVKRHTKRKKINKPKKKKVSIRTAKTGGQVVKKAAGGKMSHVGLSPAEESRSGTMSEAKRKKYKHGGKIHHNTSRENRLEELGRVDAEKAYTRKGKRNLKDEKKRIVRGLKKGGQVTNGNDFVSQFYEISTDT